MSAARTWLREHDPGYGALRRAARTALIMPALLALGDVVIANPIVATFAAFGSFAMLLLVDFTGPIRTRLLDQSALGVACAVLISLATLVSRTTWLSALTMGVVAFVVLFAGAVSSVLAGAATSLLLSFILPVSLRGSAASIPDRVAGWGLAVGASLVAISALWPSPTRDPIRTAAIAACRALAERLSSWISYATRAGTAEAQAAHRSANARAEQAVATMERLFFAAPYRPTGLSTDARAAIRLVDELRWLNSIVLRTTPMARPSPPSREVSAVKLAAADVLEHVAGLLEEPLRSRDGLRSAADQMRRALADLELATMILSPAQLQRNVGGESSPQRIVSSLDPSFRAEELSFVVDQIAANSDFAAAAARRSWTERILGRQPEGIQGTLSAAEERATAQVARDSLWLRNSLRGGVALGLAVLVADLSGVQHGFWGGCLWDPGRAPLQCAEHRPEPRARAHRDRGRIRRRRATGVPDWDRHGGPVGPPAVGDSVRWARAVGDLVCRGAGRVHPHPADPVQRRRACRLEDGDPTRQRSSPPRREALQAAAASRRLDVTFRGYLAERGSKPAPLAAVAELVTGVTGVRLVGDAVLELWNGNAAGTADRSAARRELTVAAASVTNWYERFAASLSGREPVPKPLAPDEVANGRLVDAVARDLVGTDGHATATGVRVIWTGDHLDALRRLQAVLVPPARGRTGRGL
jgi:hypothetical protein